MPLQTSNSLLTAVVKTCERVKILLSLELRLNTVPHNCQEATLSTAPPQPILASSDYPKQLLKTVQYNIRLTRLREGRSANDKAQSAPNHTVLGSEESIHRDIQYQNTRERPEEERDELARSFFFFSLKQEHPVPMKSLEGPCHTSFKAINEVVLVV